MCGRSRFLEDGRNFTSGRQPEATNTALSRTSANDTPKGLDILKPASAHSSTSTSKRGWWWLVQTFLKNSAIACDSLLPTVAGNGAHPNDLTSFLRSTTLWNDLLHHATSRKADLHAVKSKHWAYPITSHSGFCSALHLNEVKWIFTSRQLVSVNY